jgi:hypothetical protein
LGRKQEREEEMKYLLVAVAILIAVSLVAASDTPAAAEHQYVGVDACKMCHKKEEKGNQFGSWEGSKHAQAYATLGSDAAKEVGAKMGIADPQQSPECLKCHATGYGADASMFDAKYKIEEGVGCESCHGPGKDYKNIKIMKDVEAAKANGLIIPDEGVCKKCHNEQSPTYKAFNFEERSAEIAHPDPTKGQ